MRTSYNKKTSFNEDKQGIKLIKMATFWLTVISCITTATGLSNFVFKGSQVWQAGLISFSIQTVLFILNLKLPEYFAKIKNSINSGVGKFFVLASFVMLFGVMLFSSSLFSIVYIFDASYLSRNISYIDADIVLDSKYNEVLDLTSEYIDENIKATGIIASKQLANMDLPEASSSEAKSKEELELEKDNKYIEWQGCVKQEKILQKQYDIAASEAELLSKQAFVYERDGKSTYKDAKKKRDNLSDQLDEAQINTSKTEKAYKKALYAYENYTPTQGVLKQEFLSALLKEDLSKEDSGIDILDKDMKEITNMILTNHDNTDITSKFDEAVKQTKELNVTIDKYKALVKCSEDYSSEKYKLKERNLPTSTDSDSKDVKDWRGKWKSQYEKLKVLVKSTPLYIKSNSDYVSKESVNVEVLESYDSDKIIDEINEIERLYLTDINILERSFNSFSSKYKFNIWFATGFAVILDFVGFLIGLFIYYYDKSNLIVEDRS